MSQSNDGRKAFTNGAVALAFGARVKISSGTVVVCTAGDEGIGNSTESAAASAVVNIRLDNHSVEAIASGAIAVGDDVYAANGGAMSATLSGRRQGIALEIAADAETFEMLPVGVNS